MEIEIQKYETCLNEIKKRIDVIRSHLTLEQSTNYLITEVEFLAIQFRKVIELIAFSSLVVNREKYEKFRKMIDRDFKSDWNPKRIFQALGTINPHFYPLPSEQIERSNKEGKQIVELRKIFSGYLTKEEAIDVYDKCSGVLHAWNPYADEKDINAMYGQFHEWLNKLRVLLNHHMIVLGDDNLMVCAEMQSRVNGNPKAFVFGKVSDTRIETIDKDVLAELRRLGLHKK